MKKRQVIVCLLTLFLLLGLGACRELTVEEIRERNEARWERLPNETQTEHRIRADFAWVFWFDFENNPGGRPYPLRAIRRSGMRTVAFVASQEESEVGNENTFYFWPTHVSSWILDDLNQILHEEFNDWDTVSVSYPITTEDLIEHWEEIWDLCINLDIVRPRSGWTRLSP